MQLAVQLRIYAVYAAFLIAGKRLARPERLLLGLPGDRPRGFGEAAGVPSRGMSVTKLRSTRYGVSFPTVNGFSHGSLRSATASRARSSCALAARTNHLQRSACSGCLTFSLSHPSRSFQNLIACSMENPREYARQMRSRSGSPLPCHHSQRAFGWRRRSPLGSRSTSTSTTVPLTTAVLSEP